MQKAVKHVRMLSYLEEDGSVTREMIYMDAILLFHCLLPDVHLGFNVLPLRYLKSNYVLNEAIPGFVPYLLALLPWCLITGLLGVYSFWRELASND